MLETPVTRPKVTVAGEKRHRAGANPENGITSMARPPVMPRGNTRRVFVHHHIANADELPLLDGGRLPPAIDRVRQPLNESNAIRF